MIPQHSSKSVEHYGPDWIPPLVREAFGGPIDLDPASCPAANRLIGAARYYTEAEDGLSKPWEGNVYLNPPGGRCDYQGQNVSRPALWWATLAHRFTMGKVTQAIFMVFNLELFRYAQSWAVPHPLDYPVCFPKERVDFWAPDKSGGISVQGSPAHSNAIVYLGANFDRFQATFTKIGRVIRCV